MTTTYCTEISVKGKFITVPVLFSNGVTVIIEGEWLKMATIKDEFWLPGSVVGDPESIISELKSYPQRTDIFTFSQKPPDTEPRYKFHLEWGNLAGIKIKNFDDWWEKLPQVVRKNVRRAGKRGVVVRKVEFSDELIGEIVKINNEMPIRQGRPFWHYGKSFAAVKKDYSDFLDRTVYFGAYFGGELIGFIRLIEMGEVVSVLQLLNMNAQYDKRPANALIASAVEFCAQKGVSYLLYGQYIYGGNAGSQLTEFKRRNGFEKILIPTYIVPLTARGRCAFKMGLHHGIRGLIPPRIKVVLSDLRSKVYRIGSQRRKFAGEEDSN